MSPLTITLAFVGGTVVAFAILNYLDEIPDICSGGGCAKAPPRE